MCNVRAFQRQIIGSAQLVMRQFQDRVRELKRMFGRSDCTSNVCDGRCCVFNLVQGYT
jgi:hypothetical protein